MDNDQNGKTHSRFRCFMEPSGTWMVWDDLACAPAALGGSVLKRRSEVGGAAARDILERIYRNRLDAYSARTNQPGGDAVSSAGPGISEQR
jgi:hypothetical protein